MMLPDHLRELLTAAIDGELAPAERKIVDRLLRTSEEARRYHAQLQADAGRLRQLPKSTPEIDLVSSIVTTILEEGITPTPLPTRRKRHTVNASFKPSWIPMAIAASVVLVLSLGSYFYFTASDRYSGHGNPSTASRNPSTASDNTHHQPHTVPPKDNVVVAQPELAPYPQILKDQVVVDRSPESLPFPQVVGSQDVITTPTPVDGPGLEQVKIRLPLILPLRDLDQAYPREKFHEEIKKDNVIRVDLFAKDPTKATELLYAALRNRGHQLFVDAYLAERLKKKSPTEILLFTECLTPDDFAQLFEQLGNEDKKAETKKAGDGVFDRFVLSPYLPGDLDKLARLLGVTGAQLKMPKSKALSATEQRKSLEEGTANALLQNLPRPVGVGKPSDKLALSLSYTPANIAPSSSKEIKSFLEKRGERKPGSVPVLLVIRTLN